MVTSPDPPIPPPIAAAAPFVFCCHLSVLDGNFARTLRTTANTCRKIPSLSSYLTAGNAHFTISTEAAAANACTKQSTYCMDFSVCDFQIQGASLISSTNTRTAMPAIRVQRGACIFCGDGQFSGRSIIIFLDAGMVVSTLQGIVSLQLQGRVTFASYLHRGLTIVAHIDITSLIVTVVSFLVQLLMILMI